MMDNSHDMTVIDIHSFWIGLDAGLVGFSITYAFAVMGIFQWTVIQSTKVETEVYATDDDPSLHRLTMRHLSLRQLF